MLYFHQDCYFKNNNINTYKNQNVITPTKKFNANDVEKFIIVERLKEFIKKINLLKEQEGKNCKEKFKCISKIFDVKIIEEEIENVKEAFFSELFDKIKNELIKEEIKKYKNLNTNEEIYKKQSEKWEEKWKKKINNYIKENNLKKYINIKDIKYLNNGNSNSNLLTSWQIYYEYVERIQKDIYINLYEIKPFQSTSDLTLVFNKELGDESTIENYFPSHNNGLIINKERGKLKIIFKKKVIEEYNGLYDYDRISDTLIVYRQEEGVKKLGIHYNGGQSKSIICNQFVSESSIITKIMLIPCYQAYEKQSILLFIGSEIHMIQINNENEYPKVINLKNEFKYNKFNEFQFIIYLDFLLILHFNSEEKKWEGKVYSLCLEDESLFNLIKNINVDDSNEKSIFSFAEIKDNKYLFSLNIFGNTPIIHFWKIDSKLSGISTDYQKRNKNKQENNKTALGNCVINYFYHCFEKYPLIGALPYNLQKYEKKAIKISFYLKDDLNDKIHYLEKYVDMLKMFCEGKKKISFHDMNFSFCQNYNEFFKSQKLSLGILIIKIIEITPIQIAKIMEHELKIMNNGENIEKKLYFESKKRIEQHKEAKFDIQNFSKIINFCMKDSIFNYFEIPVIVICCFGKQSIGKSTFLNELTGSLFDVSGKRCTEGIWMSIKLFIHKLKNKEKNSCKNTCINCNNKKCEQIAHKEVKYCLCNDCICNKECFLDQNNSLSDFKSCFKKCCLKKGHEIGIQCSFENCECKCICECICSKYNKTHNHICKDCKKKQINPCECNCNCKHYCGIPIILHNFICVCLDFEGLGTFERTQEQDIQMALVGSALGNSIIFRTDNTFDRFTENILEKLALGSNIEQYFGGSLFFCPKDVNSTDREKLKEEFTQKIKNSVIKWNYSMMNQKEKENRLKNNKYTIFGIFEDNVFAPTPDYRDYSFYKTLRDNLTKEIIENNLKFKRNPKYRTGKEFYSNLKLFLSVVYMNDYEFLTNCREKLISDYVYENIDKAYEICGILKMDDQKNNALSILENNAFKYYIKNDYLEELGIDFYSNSKFKINNSLEIDNIHIPEDIHGIFKSEKYSIKISINKVDINNKILLENLNDFGLILLIFKEIKESLNYEMLCSNLFDIWDDICQTIRLNDRMIIEYFSLFIKSVINRRKTNVQKWLEEITKSMENLKELRNQYSPISNIWILCRQQCKYCYYTCCLLQGHKDEHKCPYDHNCKESCSLCTISKCSEKDCGNKCIEKAGHPEGHKCNHFHQCPENCYFKNYTSDCKGRCNLNLGHDNNHSCGMEIHHCNENCELYSNARNCNGKCILTYPHEGKDHYCGGIHFCKKECYLKEKSKGCKVLCNFEYGHEGNCYCGGEHICIENCIFMGKAKNCFEKCNLPFPHEGKEHNCGKIHYCNKKCSLANKASGCIEICNLEYGHEGDDNCGKQHYCNQDCSLKDLAEGCGKKCNLEYPHEGRDHMCSEEHFCKKNCQLFGKSKECKEICSLKYNHDGDCICTFSKEQHKCNKTCFNCKNDCILPAGHEAQCCICGRCKCPKECKFNNISRGCLKNCQLNAGHNGEHLCNSKHFCKNECWLKNISKKCNHFCSVEITYSSYHSDHQCNIPIENHGCNGICSHFNYSRNCKKNCSREVNHSGQHLCEISLDQHLCKKNCDLFGNSLNCKQLCNLPFSHMGNHLCEIGASNHLCNKKCSLLNYSRIGCIRDCSLPVGHPGNCLCRNSVKMHICNNICNLFDKSKGCKQYCNLMSGHKGEHQCEINKNNHKCKGICSLKGKTKGKYYEICCLVYGHIGDCICKQV